MAVSLADSRASRLCVHPFDPLSAECGSHEWIRKVLCFARNLDAAELHDAHGVGRLGVICQDEFGDPKIVATDDSPDRKPLIARLTGALALYLASTAGSLARLRVVQHRVLEIDEVLRFKIVGIGRRPMLIQCRTDLLISHSRILLLLLLIVHLEQSRPSVVELRIDHFAGGFCPKNRQHWPCEEPDLLENRSLVPIDVLMCELALS